MKGKQVGIYGAGGFAREVEWLISSTYPASQLQSVCYVDDSADRQTALNGLAVLSFDDFRRRHADAVVAIAVGDPAAREKIAAKCSATGVGFVNLVHESVRHSERVTIGEGGIVCAGCILTVDIELGPHVHVNLDCTIGHDVEIGAHSTLAPGVHVSGNVRIGAGVYVGTGVNIINGAPGKPLTIGDGCVIGAGSCVTTNLEAGRLYVGVPAREKRVLR